MDEKVLNILQNIEKRLTDLEKNMNELSKKTVHSFHLDIKNVQTLNLDELSYYLEHIDVKELSGTLNIGNTLPSQTNQYQAPGKKGKKIKNDSDVNRKSGSQNNKAKNKEKGPSEISVKINERSVPYTLTHMEEMREPDQALESTFSIGDIHIGTIEDASAVNFGNNFPTNFRSHKKVSQGFGNILGNQNDIHDILSSLEEKDISEVYNESQDGKPPQWLDTMVEEQTKEMDETKLNEDEKGE
ncbi:hypothetical protein [Priestia megaterium]|uniref:hypothetical protein n=1 Tax=Priestia megaterium TaxID=1404 RepID=UPI00209E4A7D|nr:hypothetical protein [Priestia megaterium]MCP1451331.1 hypothetical protein [Priestia megaterium]MED4049890.1 hypothetical protein [Priestia megaterium]WJD82796.1 hypothetical protein QRD24_09965 [Priestia megaterium]